MDNSEIAVYFSTFHPPLLLHSSIAPMLTKVLWDKDFRTGSKMNSRSMDQWTALSPLSTAPLLHCSNAHQIFVGQKFGGGGGNRISLVTA